MKTFIINQTPFSDPMLDYLKADLRDSKIKSFRALVAFISWSGFENIHEDLEKFYDKDPSKLKMIIGIGSDAAEVAVLRYLTQRMPNGYFRIFNASNNNYTFHPKVYFFDKDESLIVYVGSSNFTLGGLYFNSECSIKLVLNRRQDKSLIEELEKTWDTYYKPQKPFNAGNLKEISTLILNKLDKVYLNHRGSAIKRKIENNDIKSIFSQLYIKAPTPSVKIEKPKLPVQKPIHPSVKSTILLLEVLIETGANGTQVQIPSKVLSSYFDVKAKEQHKTIKIKFPNADFRPSVICQFGNFTYRFTIPEINGMKRPLLLKFIKHENNKYEVSILTGTNYNRNIVQCTNQTRHDAKRWIIK
jgi:HKD family nuclease